jgi:DNA-binding HxlR family transcriptional regulator
MGTDETSWCCGEEATCYVPLSDLLDTLSKKYAMAILCVVAGHDSLRFSEIDEHLEPASTSTITDRLDDLAGAGLLDREQYDEIPPRVEYTLTEEGHTVCDHLTPLLEWIGEQT